jgi:transmembrane sensor
MSGREDEFRVARINQEASDWVAKQDRGLTAVEQDAFFDWLAEDPLHSEAYSRRQIVWKEMDVLADWCPEHSLEPNPDLLARERKGSKTVWFSVISGIAALLVIGLFIGSRIDPASHSESIMLASGEAAQFYEHHVLEDGSAVELNRGAQVAVRLSDEKRLIDLLAGEAHFTVAKDVHRPFLVRARGTVVQAVGTAFNVLLGDDTIEVIVTEGEVLMNPSIATTQQSLIDEAEPLVRKLNAGQRSVVELNAEVTRPAVEALAVEQIERRLSWKDEMLDFTDTPLSEAILEFNRRNHTQLVLEDPSLADIKVTGAFRPSRIDEFVELLRLVNDVQADPEGDSKIILK